MKGKKDASNCVPRKGKTDDGNGCADNGRRHDFVNPVNARVFYDKCDNDVNEPCQSRADDETKISHRHACRTAKRRAHRADKGEGRAEENGALKFGEKQVDEGAYACAEQRCRLTHAVADNSGYSNRRRKDSQYLLKCED